MSPVNRRDFIAASALGLAAVSASFATPFAAPTVFAEHPQEKLRLGRGGRGLILTTFLSQIPNAEIVAVCDRIATVWPPRRKNF